jgi:trimeric autotransporter adhesin
VRTPRSSRLDMVRLEDRTAPAVFTVTTTQDNGNNTTPTAGSLRAAILSANSTAGADTINFNITGGGVQTILPPNALPALTESVTIDGTSQPGYAGTPVVVLSGNSAGAGANGLALSNHTISTIKGLALGGWNGAGVRIDGGGQHQIRNNHIGVNAAGTGVFANTDGIVITTASKNNLVGGTQDARNVISGNKQSGVLLAGGSEQNTIAANFLGVAFDGVTPLGNGTHGVWTRDGAAFTTVGGTTAGAGNIIASNGSHGVRISDPVTAGVLVQGNRIGLDFAGTASGNGGDGVHVDNFAGTTPFNGLNPPTTNNRILANTIQRNQGNGVAVRSNSRYVRILDNSIALNGGLGIDVDANANNGLAAPAIAKVTADTINALTVTGSIVGQPSTQYLVTVYTNSVADPSGFGEGETKAATVTVTTNASGQANYTANIAAALSAPFVAATVTDVVDGDTSAFSPSVARPPRGLDGRLAFAGAGSGAPTVNLYDSSGAIAATLTVFDASFTGGVRVAAGDFNADGVPDVIAATGPGSVTLVRVIDPVTQKVLFEVQPFESAFTGGVYVSAGDLNGDGKADIVVSPDEGGGPRVDVYSGDGFGKLASFFGIGDPNFRGGARTAVGDVNNDKRADLAVAAGFGGGPRVAVFNGTTVTTGTPTVLFNDFFAFEQTLRNGVFIAVGDINDDGFAEVIAGGGPGGGPRITAFSGKGLLSNQYVPVANYFAGNDSNRGGIRIAARDLNADGSFEIMAGDGPGGEGRLRVYTGSDLIQGGTDPRLNVVAFAGAAGGVFVG